jgi:hypothetical protein
MTVDELINQYNEYFNHKTALYLDSTTRLVWGHLWYDFALSAVRRFYFPKVH